MNAALYEAFAFAMRYWFILVIAIVLISVISASAREYKDRKNILGRVNVLAGYVEIVEGPENWLGEKIGIGNENIIGRNARCEVSLNDGSVSKAHALLYKESDDLKLTPLSKAETYVNNWIISAPTTLKTGDIISVGNISLRLFIKRVRPRDDY